MSNILLVEDEIDIQRANKIILERRGGYTVRLAMNLAEARQSISESMPNLIVLDIMLPDGTGLDFLAELRNDMGINIPVLLLTALSETSDELKGIQAGGDDYITKPYDNRVLLAKIERALHRASIIPDTITLGKIKIDTASNRAFVNGNDIDLTPKEISLLGQFIQNPEKIMSSEYMYKKVWGQEMGKDDTAFRKAVSGLRTKLTEHEAGYTITASKGEGYYFAQE
ncbi:MAG: response regulator transcription factor [Defluviitaleaceae bacterium]|nr:response regulator transcription factor [Defluviitaleaceae bacterium]MCL2263082.1 response regulator transcription factor [Defluviitaleaceae bacterium]